MMLFSDISLDGGDELLFVASVFGTNWRVLLNWAHLVRNVLHETEQEPASERNLGFRVKGRFGEEGQHEGHRRTGDDHTSNARFVAFEAIPPKVWQLGLGS